MGLIFGCGSNCHDVYIRWYKAADLTQHREFASEEVTPADYKKNQLTVSYITNWYIPTYDNGHSLTHMKCEESLKWELVHNI